MESSGDRHPQGTADHDAETITAIAEKLRLIAKTRARLRVINTDAGGPDAAYEQLRRLLP